MQYVAANCSWNCYGAEISQPIIARVADALSTKTHKVRGRRELASLCDLGYCELLVDLGWEGCGQGVNHTQHAEDGV